MSKTFVYLFDVTLKNDGNALIKKCLKDYLSRFNREIDKLIIMKDDKGKPYIKDNPIYFNISHSKRYWVCAIDDSPVGIDIEYKRSCDTKKIARRFMHKDEADFIDKNEEHFFDIWCAKESYVKYHGWGIDDNFNLFSVVSENKLINKIDDIYLHPIKVSKEYSLCLATKSSTYQLISMLIDIQPLNINNYNDALALINDYIAELAIDLSFQDVKKELNDLWAIYKPPFGRLFISYLNDQAIGCVGLKPFDQDSGEVKRLFVREEFRQYHVAQQLMLHLIKEAKAIGYKKLVLDTLDSLDPANKLYLKLGFTKIPPYYDNPLANVSYFALDLTTSN